ncbi:histone-lysine N-methyltransferase SMYD3 isoform X2 [Fopius arisanus]|uniref:Histone-lysine N-methyltransferase SMYD3 isoform X2 n=1 Tax=Fopius arisanus TaxID=64838 RepID=A0A0C9PKW1_9HYME|nr:PREDICTED: histone-lysine N-methyltransferase SMYD3 isoform X2 [Fopius arisanus]
MADKAVPVNGMIQEIKKGKTILTAEPFAFVLSEQHRKERCDQCFKSSKISRCAGCQYVYYCGRNCQRKAWAIHKIECPNIKRIHPRVLPDAARMMARIIIKLSQNGREERGYYTPTKYRVFDDLMSHVIDIKEDMKKMEHFTSLSMVLLEFLPNDILPDVKELLAIFGRMSVNSFNILDTDMTSLGVGIYLGPSIIDHNCKPNATAVFEGTTLMIRTLHDLPALDWSQIHITYIDVLKDMETRRAELRKSYYFLCECERCNTPETIEIAAACPNKTCTYPCQSTDSHCPKCCEEFPEGFKECFDEVCELSVYHLEKMAHTAYLDAARMCLTKQEGILHPYNLLVVRMLEMALAATMDLERWEDAEVYASQLTGRYLFYFGETHPMTGQVHFVQAKLFSFQKKGRLALESITKAAQLIKISFGEDHSKIKNEIKPLLDQLLAEYHYGKNGF